MNETQMANHLVKWWKTKFLNGYKQFTAVLPTDCSDGRPSDTEELLQQQHDHHPTTPIPPPVPPSPTPTHTPTHTVHNNITNTTTTPNNKQQSHQQLNFEGFECDVSVEGGGLEGTAKDRQEFSFTLYDFDGHGKITKDDIAGLVTTIYETLGSSIKVPHYGSKTIKVKLTVSPDQNGVGVGLTKGGPGGTPCAPPPPGGPPRYKRDLNVTIRERRPRRHHHHHNHNHHHHHNHRRRHSVSSSAPSEDREADVSDEDDEDDDDDDQPHSRLNFINSRLTHPGNSPSSGTCCGRNKKRSSSLQRQELLQIIQANMEKNNLNFQTSRKHCNLDNDHQPKVMNNEGSSLNHHQQQQQGVWRDHCAAPRGKRGTEAPPQESGGPGQPRSSPHHLKHRHREQEQARAMAQVVRWLEQEFSPTRRRGGTAPAPTPAHHSSTHNHNLNQSHHSKQLRHEHHHIHEYIHHHYHHYQDTSLVV